MTLTLEQKQTIISKYNMGKTGNCSGYENK